MYHCSDEYKRHGEINCGPCGFEGKKLNPLMGSKPPKELEDPGKACKQGICPLVGSEDLFAVCRRRKVNSLLSCNSQEG